jgi:hypothetical protein
MLTCGCLSVGWSRNNSQLFFWLVVFVGLVLNPVHVYSQPLSQVANQRSQQYQRERERLAAEQQFFPDLAFSRYSALGRPLFLKPLNFASAQATGTAGLSSGQSGITLRGEGMQIAAWDDGRVAPHQELDTRVVANEGTQTMTHASHVAGTLIATGLNPAARGMAPRAQLLAFRFDNDEAEMAALAAERGARLLVSNHSYGTVTGWTSQGGAWRWAGNPAVSGSEDYQFGLYTEKARLLDEIAFLAPNYTVCWAAGNDRGEPGDGSRPPDCNGGTGYDCIIPDAVAKNIITVGAVDPVVSYSSPASVQMSSYSSWGPTDDGRIKPDLVGVGTNVFSLSATPNDTYTVLSGTSMATPNVSGSLLLLQELHQKLSGGRSMRAATLKALAIHTAKEAGPFPGPDYRFGWGLLDAQAAATLLSQCDGAQTFVLEQTLLTGENWVLNLNPQAGRKISITVAWTDPAAAPAPDELDPANLALVNDLDIRLTDDQGMTQLPWVLNPASPADRATRGDNFRDNVEKIELDLPVGRPYQLRLSHKGTLVNGRQDYSIIITYTALGTARNLYWIGDDGNWNESRNWSLTSGGSAAFTLPTAADRIIVDENSFDTTGDNAIQLAAPVTVRSLTWLSARRASIRFNGHTITVSQEARFASPGFYSDAGSIQFSNPQPNQSTVDLFDLDVPELQFRFVAGNWRLTGRGKLKALETQATRLAMQDADLRVEAWRGDAVPNTEWSFTRARITLAKEFLLENASRVAVSASDALVIAKGDVRFDASNLGWPVETRVDSGSLTVIGSGNTFRRVRSSGDVLVTGSNKIESLDLLAGKFTVAPGTRQQVSNLSMNRDVSLDGAANALFELTIYRKFCFEQVRVSNLALVGKGVVSVGNASTLINAPGWQTSDCANTLFADFAITFPCANGQTHFQQNASGQPTSFSWTFQQLGATGSSNSGAATFRFPSVGTAQVRLVVTRGTSTHQRYSVIQIRGNSIPENQILATSDRLASFIEADFYEWYRDQQKIAGQSDRFFAHAGEPGAYEVLAFQGPCNRWSPIYTVTNIAESVGVIAVYPNPTSDYLFVKSHEAIQSISIFDTTGRCVLTESASSVDVRQLSVGLYVCEVRTSTQRIRKKVAIGR